MKILENNSMKTLLIQKQSQSIGLASNAFSSLINQNDNDLEETVEETSSNDLNIHQQDLQHKAYLNKLSLGM